jgi:hypothetical protein
VRARAGAGAARVAGEAGEADEAAHAAVEALEPPVEAVECEREPAPERRGLQERPERPMKLPMLEFYPVATRRENIISFFVES